MSVVEQSETTEIVEAHVIGPWDDRREKVSFTGFPLIDVKGSLGEVHPDKRKRISDDKYAYEFMRILDGAVRYPDVKLILITDLSAQSLRFWHKTDMGFYKSKYKLRFAVIELNNNVVRYMAWL